MDLTSFVTFSGIAKVHSANTVLDFQHSPLKLRRGVLMCTKETRSNEQSSFFLHNLCIQKNLSVGQAQSPEFYQAPTSSGKHSPFSVWADFFSVWADFFFQSGHILYKAGGASIEISLL